jgi:hypothetical protein
MSTKTKSATPDQTWKLADLKEELKTRGIPFKGKDPKDVLLNLLGVKAEPKEKKEKKEKKEGEPKEKKEKKEGEAPKEKKEKKEEGDAPKEKKKKEEKVMTDDEKKERKERKAAEKKAIQFYAKAKELYVNDTYLEVDRRTFAYNLLILEFGNIPNRSDPLQNTIAPNGEFIKKA